MIENLSASNSLARFESTVLERLKDSNRFDDFIACKDAFDDLLLNGDLTNYLNSELSKSLGDPAYYPTAGPERSLMIIDRPEYKAFLIFLSQIDIATSEQRRFIAGATGHQMIGCISGSPITFMKFRQPNPEPCEVFDRERGLIREADVVIAAGQTVVFEASRDAFCPTKSDASLVLRLTTTHLCHTRWDYDKRTGEPIRAVAASLVDSRVDFAVRTLGRVGNAASVPVLVNLCDHPAHFIRWSAIQALAMLAPDKAVSMLESARRDVHPHIREAAHRTLESINLQETPSNGNYDRIQQ